MGKILKNIFILSLANVASSLHYFLIVYVASSYLEQFLSTAENGLVFSVAAGLMILGFIATPFVLEHLSVRRISLTLTFVGLVSLLILSLNPSPAVAISLIALETAIVPLIAYMLDLFLANATTDKSQVGHIRGLFLTSGNVALVASPILIGVVLNTSNDYSRIFLASAVTLSFFAVLLMTRKHFFVGGKITRSGSIFSILRCLVLDKEIRSVLGANLILQSFYVWVGIYIPLYLHSTLGFSWEILGPIFALMLLPFLVVELPMGFIEDKFKGVRFIMMGGFLLMGVSLAALSFVTATTSLTLITIILASTRIGAALVEITAETSFFRGVDGEDVESVGLFRMTRPLSMLVGPLVASFFLLSLSLQTLFIPLGIICLFGIPFALRTKDNTSQEVRTRICSVR